MSLHVETACATLRSGRVLPILMFLDAEDKECQLIDAIGCVVSGPSTAFFAEMSLPEMAC